MKVRREIAKETEAREAAEDEAAVDRAGGARGRADAELAAAAATRMAGGVAGDLRLVRVALDADRTMPRADRTAAGKTLVRGQVLIDGVTDALAAAAATAADSTAAAPTASAAQTFARDGADEAFDARTAAAAAATAAAAVFAADAARSTAFEALDTCALAVEGWSATAEETLLRHLNRLHAIAATSVGRCRLTLSNPRSKRLELSA